MTLRLRDYQQHGMDMLRQAIRAGNRRIIFQGATGFGKTEVAAQMIMNALDKGKRVVFTVNKIVLAEQASVRLDKYGVQHGIWQAQNERFNPELPCQIASVQTLARRKPMEDIDLFIVDEAHIHSEVFDKLKAYNPQAYFIGLTASPYSILAPWWQKLVAAVPMQTLMDNGHLVPYEVYAAPTADLSKVKVVAGEYQNKSLAEATDKPKLTGSVIAEWKKRGENRQTICFAVNRAHALHLEQEFNRHGIPAKSIDCYTEAEERREVINKFNTGELRILISIMILTTGFDSPIASCAIFACATKSRIKHVQSLGRVLRPCKGKKDATCIDHGGNFSRLGFPEDYDDTELDDGKRAKQKKKEKKTESLPKPCPKCQFMKPAKVQVCPMCGFKAQHIKDVEFEQGDLIKIQRKKNRELSKQEKQEFYSGLLAYCKKTGKRDGWAAHKYRERLGVWPNAMKKEAGQITPQVQRYIQHINIAYSKARNHNI